jgi:class 3 adenylate cyclase
MRCSKCGTEGIVGKKFCAECGSPLSNRCSKCNSDNAPGAKFCADCGNALSEAVGIDGGKSFTAEAAGGFRLAPERQSSEALEGERKTVTALFADIKGSTEMMEGLDPEEARAIIDPALKIMVEAVRRYDGYVVQSTGDGIFALFGAPLAHEDHPQRALNAALQIQQELRQHGLRVVQGRPALEARIGVNTGEVVVRTVETGGKVEYTPIGHTANLASRLQTVAPAGSIAIGDDTRKLVEGYFELRGLGPMEVKGVSDPINVYEVTGPGPLRSHFQLAARRGLTKFVGRERELAEMKRALELARSGHGQLIAVVAEAGTGKSRLFYEFKAALPPDCKLLEAYSVSHGKASAWLPVLELLRSYFGIRDADDSAARREKVSGALAALDPTLNDAIPYLLGLLGIQEGPDPLAQMDPQVKRRRTLDAIKRMIVRESLNQATVLIFEDLHWIDGETQALLDLLADSIANSRLLLLVNYRPEYRHEWGNKSYYAQLRLDALGPESAGTMLATLLGDGVHLDPLKRMVIERTEGNPFFIEEMVQALFDEGVLVRNGVTEVTRSLSQLRLPTTVQGMLAARVDRLPAELKELLQTLAVIGKESSLGVIRRVVSMAETQLDGMLYDLQAGEFLYEQPVVGDHEPRANLHDSKYVFKHALTQEVAYSSLLFERRKILHERAGQVLESVFAGHLDDYLGELANHYGQSANVNKAVEYVSRAGNRRCSAAVMQRRRDMFLVGWNY